MSEGLIGLLTTAASYEAKVTSFSPPKFPRNLENNATGKDDFLHLVFSCDTDVLRDAELMLLYYVVLICCVLLYISVLLSV